MCEPRELTEIEMLVVRLLDKPGKIPTTDLAADFLLRAFGNPTDLIQAVFAAVDWTVINEHMEQRT
jgi:hypothetical protein